MDGTASSCRAIALWTQRVSRAVAIHSAFTPLHSANHTKQQQSSTSIPIQMIAAPTSSIRVRMVGVRRPLAGALTSITVRRHGTDASACAHQQQSGRMAMLSSIADFLVSVLCCVSWGVAVAVASAWFSASSPCMNVVGLCAR